MKVFEHWNKQLSAGNGVTFEGRPIPPRPDVDHTLTFERFVHGELKLSIYPTPRRRVERSVLTAMGNDMNQGVARLPSAVKRYKWRKEERLSSLVQRSEFQDACKEISGWGALPRKKIFRRTGRRAIQEAGEIAWRKYGKSGIFLTGTIPGSGPVIAATVAKYSGWLMNRVLQSLRDSFSSSYSALAVWELQKRGMLHIHLCVCSTETHVLEKILSAWKKRFNELLIQLSDKTGVDLFRKNESWTWRDDLEGTRQDAQFLRQNPARYLAKYLSKGSRKQASEYEYHPSRWWSVDRKTAAEAKSERMRIQTGG